ncbi:MULTISPECIES: hypothetical protein [unclassified Achromobacter]|uniref:hypothetical protein n=1 Tax=unclassified Achromobacter TaxID=2626865 RepID=UPI0011781C98|nr:MULTISPECIES: hypothetical protein [unclassified Achromobacter]
MNGPSYTNNVSSPSKHDACIQQAGLDFGIAHCLDATTHWLVDDYAQSLRGAVKTTAQIFNGRRMLFSDQEQDDLTSRLKLCRTLPSPDREDVPVIDALLRTLLPSHFSQLVSTMAERKEMGMFNRELFEQVCHEGARTQAVARATQWQRKSSADGMRVQHAVDAAFSSDEPVLAYKVALLRKPFIPENEAAAYALHECAKGNELLFQQALSGEKTHRQLDTLHRPSIALTQNDLHALQDGLDRAAFINAWLRGGVITVNFSRVHGLYLGAVLLADGRAAPSDLADEVDRLSCRADGPARSPGCRSGRSPPIPGHQGQGRDPP